MPWWAWLLLSIFGPVCLFLMYLGITALVFFRDIVKNWQW